MRCTKLLLMVGLVLAVGGQAWADGIPFTQSYNGAVYWHISNWDEGTFYTGFLVDGVTPVTAGSTYTPGELERVGPTGGIGAEDSWGIFRVESIFDAVVDPFQTDTITIGSTALYEYGSVGQTVEVVGIFHGRTDNTISFVDLTPLNPLDPLTQIILSSGDSIELYTQPKGTTELFGAGWGGGMQGPGQRIAAGVYPGIGFDALGNPIVGSDLALAGNAQAGFQMDEVVSQFTPTPGGTSGSGSFGMYISWTGGSQLTFWDTNVFPIGYVLPVTADLRLQGTITPTGLPAADPWLVHTSDPGTTSVIPEPMTMAGMLLGIGCLGRYIRKRR